MSWLSRVLAVVMIFFGTGMYLVILGGAIAPLWDILAGMPAVTNGPFWNVAQRYKFIAQNIIPGLLILSGIIVWVVSGVREESNRQQQVRRVGP